MGKKKKTDEVTALATTVTTSLAASVDISKDDVVAIAMSRYEDKLDIAMDECRSKLKNLQEDLNKAREAVENECQAVAEGHLKKEADDISKTLRDAGYITKDSDPEIKAEHTSTKVGDKIKHEIRMTSTLGSVKRGYSSYTLEKHVNIKAPASVKKLIAAEDKIAEKLFETKERQVELKRLQSDLGRMERKARGRLAESALAASPEGRAVLAEVQASVPTEL